MEALEKATTYLNRSPHTEKEVIDYLLRKGYERGEAESAAAQLKEYGYIDDLSYAKLYFEYGFEKGRGTDRIRRELAGKGISRELIDLAYNELENVPDEYEMALSLAARIADESGGVTGEMSYKDRQKLQAKIVRRLAARGFSGSDSYSAAREIVK